jgi:hypothetical protein
LSKAHTLTLISGPTGQPDAGTLSGGEFSLHGGFFGNPPLQSPAGEYVFLPFVIRVD